MIVDTGTKNISMEEDCRVINSIYDNTVLMVVLIRNSFEQSPPSKDHISCSCAALCLRRQWPLLAGQSLRGLLPVRQIIHWLTLVYASLPPAVLLSIPRTPKLKGLWHLQWYLSSPASSRQSVGARLTNNAGVEEELSL